MSLLKSAPEASLADASKFSDVVKDLPTADVPFDKDTFLQKFQSLRSSIQYPSRTFVNNVQRLFELCSAKPHRFHLSFQLKGEKSDMLQGVIYLDGVMMSVTSRGRGKRAVKSRCFDMLADKLTDVNTCVELRENEGGAMVLDFKSCVKPPETSTHPSLALTRSDASTSSPFPSFLEGLVLNAIPRDCDYREAGSSYRLRYLLAAGLDMLGDNVMKSPSGLSPEPLIPGLLNEIRRRILDLLSKYPIQAESALTILIKCISGQTPTMIPSWIAERCLDPMGFGCVFMLDYVVISEFCAASSLKEAREAASRSAVRRLIQPIISIEKVTVPTLELIVVEQSHKYAGFPPIYCMKIKVIEAENNALRMRPLILYQTMDSNGHLRGLPKITWNCRRELIIHDIQYMVQMKDDDFFKELLNNGVGLKEMLDSFFSYYSNEDKREDCRDPLSLYSLLFKLIQRIVENADVETIYSIFAFETLLDAINIYKQSDHHNALQKLLSDLFKRQSNYFTNDVSKCVKFMQKVIKTLNDSLENEESEESRQELLVENLDLMENLTETLSSLTCHSEICEFLTEIEVQNQQWSEETLLSANDDTQRSTIFRMLKLIDQLFSIGCLILENNDVVINRRLVQLMINASTAFENCLRNVYFKRILNAHGNQHEIEIVLERLLPELMEVFGLLNFLAIYNEIYPIDNSISELQSLTNSGISKVHVNYMMKFLRQANVKVFGQSDFGIDFVEENGSCIDDTVNTLNEIQKVKEVFPDLSENFIMICLESLTTSEALISALLEENLPPGLIELKDSDKTIHNFENEASIYTCGGESDTNRTAYKGNRATNESGNDRKMLNAITLELAASIADNEKVSDGFLDMYLQNDNYKISDEEVNLEYDDDHYENQVDVAADDSGILHHEEKNESVAEMRLPSNQRANVQRTTEQQGNIHKTKKKGKQKGGFFSFHGACRRRQ